LVDHRRKPAAEVWRLWTKHKLSLAEIAQRYGLRTEQAGRLLFECEEDD
jgi:hypothetical protein